MGIGSKLHFSSTVTAEANIDAIDFGIPADNNNVVELPVVPKKILLIVLNNTPVPRTNNYELDGTSFTLLNYPVFENDVLSIMFSY
ncbi:hypothetical protein SAMN05216480_12319 [Pustulibacterium marinum]|uniref:Uncharacterized protein n=1 Tax=Pustulibacterium marinum TaxID=1224947 RepID=A0A1I7IW59_9FLAO|nr:hypothetical protein [Pustulibacterium marinum]SFU77122.1 hypothetical protein SAMN05216480_12319 [Pustulibacterium marinum]